MTLEERLEQKEMELFILECKDHFNNEDWDCYYTLRKEIKELEKEIKNGRV